jgi:hypothetical protein
MKNNNIEIIIQNAQVAPQRIAYAEHILNKTLPGGPVLVTLGREKRTLGQNAKMWAILEDVSKQVIWYGEKLSSEDWKNIFTAALFNQKTVPGIEGGFVLLGTSTSKMKKRPFSELIELIHAFGADKNVKWSEKNETLIQEYMQWLNKERVKETEVAA